MASHGEMLQDNKTSERTKKRLNTKHIVRQDNGDESISSRQLIARSSKLIKGLLDLPMIKNEMSFNQKLHTNYAFCASSGPNSLTGYVLDDMMTVIFKNQENKAASHHVSAKCQYFNIEQNFAENERFMLKDTGSTLGHTTALFAEVNHHAHIIEGLEDLTQDVERHRAKIVTKSMDRFEIK